MTVGQRIAERLDVLSMSQAELARRVKVDQSTINALINGHSRGSKHLHRIARELHTTAEYLNLETDDPESHTPDDDGWLTAEERDIVELLRVLAPGDRKSLLQLARSLAQNAAPSHSVHAEQHAYRAER